MIKIQKTGQSVAVKVIPKTNISKSNMDLILNEITILSNLSHPNIIKLIEYYDETNSFSIVTELAKGKKVHENRW